MDHKKWPLIMMILFLTLLTSSSISRGMSISDEHKSLQGLQGLYVVIRTLPTGMQEKGLTQDQILTDVESQLRLAGIKVVSKEEVFSIPGQPRLSVDVRGGVQPNGLDSWTILVELHQLVNLSRAPEIKDIFAVTWSAGSYGTVGQHNLGTIRTEIKGIVDAFITDFLSVNPKGAK